MQIVDPKVKSPPALPHFLEKTGVMEILICSVTFLAYLRTLFFGFVYDDKPAIVDNNTIRSWHFLTRYFTPTSSRAMPSGSDSFFRPITLLWLRLNYGIFGVNPAGWHFGMVACHVLITYLVFVFVEKLSGNRVSAGIAAILFGLHPVHVENVAWLSSVNDLLLTIFLLGSFLTFIQYRDGKKAWIAPSLLLFGLALLSKETAAVFPFVILGFAATYSRSHDDDRSVRIGPVVRAGLDSIPYFAVLAMYAALRAATLHGGGQPLATVSWKTMLLTTPSILWFDVKHLLLPLSSSEFYSLPYVTAPALGGFVLPAIFLGIMMLAVLYWISKLSNARLGFMALGFTLVAILPALYLPAIALGNFVHDRFLYLPSVGVVILVALALQQIFASNILQKNRTSRQGAVLTILCFAAFVGTLMHQRQWASNIALYENAIRYAPQNTIVEVNLANEFANLDRYDRALPLYMSALQKDPRSWLSNYNLGYGYYRLGKFTEAEEYLRRAVQIDGRDPDEFIYLALSQMEQNKLPQATESAEAAIRRGPLAPGFHFVLAKILEASGNRERAIAACQAEVSAHPENQMARGELQRLQSSP